LPTTIFFYIANGAIVNKKSTSSSNPTFHPLDSYWLACIAQRHKQDDLPAKRGQAEVVPKQSMAAPVAEEVPVAKSYPRSPADSFWLKHADAHHQNKAGSSSLPRNVGVPPGDARVSIPAYIVYTVIIDDGRTHHAAWSIRNMSLSGVFLDMDVSQLQEGMIVDFILRYTHKGRVFDYRIPSKLVRMQLNGLALQFNYHDTATCHDLISLLYPV
jgi:hypothetical protein